MCGDGARRATLAALAAVAACLATACARRADPPARPAVVLAVSGSLYAALAHLAAAHGDFAAEGLDVTVRTYGFGRLALAALHDGTADVATTGDTPLVLETLHGRPSVVLATIAEATSASALVVRRGDAVPSVRGLAGGRVGLPRGSAAEFFLDAALTRAEVPRGAVTLVDLDLAALAPALAAREVDAVAAFPPYVASVARALGRDAAVLEDPGSYSTHNLVTTPALARRPEVAERLLRALLRAERRARDDRDGAVRTVAARLGIPPGEIAADWPRFQFAVALEQSLVVLLEQEARWAIRAGLAPAQEIPDFGTSLAPAPLQAVRPQAVRLVW